MNLNQVNKYRLVSKWEYNVIFYVTGVLGGLIGGTIGSIIYSIL